MRYRSAGRLLSHEQTPAPHPREHRLGRAADPDADLLHTLREHKCIRTFRIGSAFWRSVFASSPRNISRKTPGHWYYPDSQKKKLYIDERDTTIIKATALETIRLLRVRKVFSCPRTQYAFRPLPDGTESNHEIADPKPRKAFKRFEHHPFIQKAREMMMLADDNHQDDDFRLHKTIRLPDLKGFSFHGLALLCDGNPTTIHNRRGEVWMAHSTFEHMRVAKREVESYQVIGRRQYESTEDEEGS